MKRTEPCIRANHAATPPLPEKAGGGDGPAILFLDPAPGTGLKSAAFAGACRYAAVRGWRVEIVERPPANRAAVAAVLAAHPGVVGCLVECADDSAVPPPRLFGSVPAVYLHALRRPGAGALCVSTDNASVALAAYRELSAGRPAAFAVVDDGRPRLWAKARVAAFRGICRKEGRRCHLFSQRDESDAERRARRVEFLRSLPRRTAVFAVNDAMAGYVADDARSAMRSIPFDLTLLGVDNRLDICEASSPQISSIQLDFERAGFAAARMIGDFHEAEGSNGPKHGFKSGNAESIMPLLAVRRQSTGGHGRREKFVLEAVEMIRREACEGLGAAALVALPRFPQPFRPAVPRGNRPQRPRRNPARPPGKGLHSAFADRHGGFGHSGALRIRLRSHLRRTLPLAFRHRNARVEDAQQDIARDSFPDMADAWRGTPGLRCGFRRKILCEKLRLFTPRSAKLFAVSRNRQPIPEGNQT